MTAVSRAATFPRAGPPVVDKGGAPGQGQAHTRTQCDGDLHLRVHYPSPRVVAVQARGDLDEVTTPRLEELLIPRLACAAQLVVLDLSRVSFLGTAALQLLITSQERAATRRTTLRLVTGPACVRAGLRAAGLTQQFVTCATLAEAMQPAGEQDTSPASAQQTSKRWQRTGDWPSTLAGTPAPGR